MATMIFNYYDFINEILNNDSCYDGNILEEAAAIKNRGDVGELLFFLVACYGFEILLQQPIDKKDIYEICKFLDEGNNEKYSEKIKIDKNRKEIIWTAPIVHNNADHPNDVLSGICVVTQSVIDALPNIYGEFDTEIDNCIKYFTNKYQSKIYKLDNKGIEKIIICSLGPLDGGTKKEDCTIYIKTNNSNDTDVFSDDILLADKKINGKKQRVVQIENCDLDTWIAKNKRNFSDILKYSLKNDNSTVGQFTLGNIYKNFDSTGSNDVNTLISLYKDLKTFCCVYFKMGIATDKDVLSVVAKKSRKNKQIQKMYSHIRYRLNNNSISNALYNTFLTKKENKNIIKPELSNYLPLTKTTIRNVIALGCDTIVNQINDVYYKDNKKRYELLHLLLSSAISLHDNKIQLFDMHIDSSGFFAYDIVNKIKKYDESLSNINERLIINSNKNYINFIIKGEVLIQIRVKFPSDRITLYIEITNALKKLLND